VEWWVGGSKKQDRAGEGARGYTFLRFLAYSDSGSLNSCAPKFLRT